MLRIHIMNSVKGGSGKSTFSLYLANYLKTKGYNPVIIDLDVCGSTWFSNNESYIQDAKNCIFLNDLFYNYEQKSKKEHIFTLNISNNGNKDVLKVIMADPKKLSSMKDETLDLLENTVIQLVDELINPKYQTVHDKENTTDIIFDMPPGYEKHSEQIIRHLIMDIESKMKMEYTLYLYMISNVNVATFNSNLRYTNNLFVNPSYSMDTSRIPTENIVFVLNDINSSITQNLMGGRSSDNIRLYTEIFYRNITQNFEHLKKCKLFLSFHTPMQHEEDKLESITNGLPLPKILQFDTEKKQFESVFENVY